MDALAREPNPPTTVSRPPGSLEVHLADSLCGLEVEALAAASTVADIGAGAGFPGLVLAAAQPAMRVDLVEATGRKCEVIRRLGAAAGLTNFRAVATRAEEWAAHDGAAAYDGVTARALGPLAVVLEYAAPLLRVGGVLVAWRGRRDSAEESGGEYAAAILGLEPVGVRRVVPFPASTDRHLHVFRKRVATPEAYPRRPGMARKRPLGS